MRTKLYVLSLVTIAIIGCGGSNSGACCDGGFKAKGVGQIIADDNNKISDTIIKIKKEGSSNISTSQVKITGISDDSTCTPVAPCTVNAEQKTSCPAEEGGPAFVEISDCEKDAAVAKLTDYDKDTEVIVSGGVITISEANQKITGCDVEVTVNIPTDYCGQEIYTKQQVGFGGPNKDNKIYALITVTGECSTSEQKWIEGTLVGDKVVFSGDALQGITLPATLSLFRISQRPDRVTTGALSGAGGY
jgi:hypothetical protein